MVELVLKAENEVSSLVVSDFQGENGALSEIIAIPVCLHAKPPRKKRHHLADTCAETFQIHWVLAHFDLRPDAATPSLAT